MVPLLPSDTLAVAALVMTGGALFLRVPVAADGDEPVL